MFLCFLNCSASSSFINETLPSGELIPYDLNENLPRMYPARLLNWVSSIGNPVTSALQMATSFVTKNDINEDIRFPTDQTGSLFPFHVFQT